MGTRLTLLLLATAALSQHWSAWEGVLNVTALPSATWTKEGGVRIDRGAPESVDFKRASTPHVIRLPDGTLRMYYAGAGILSARSSDGLNWTKEPGIRVPVGVAGQLEEVARPFVLPLVGGGFRMYYECSSDGRLYDIRSAVSTDGLNWSIEEGVRLEHEEPAPEGIVRAMDDPFVLEIPGGYRMYYVAFDGFTARIRSAVSPDGLQWTKEPGVRVDVGPPGSPDQLGASHFYIIRLPDGKLLMYYSGGRDAVFGDSILSAVSMDGLTWNKEPGIRLSLGPPGSFDDQIMLQPSIVQLPDGRFRMYYAGYHETFRILSAIAEPTFIRVDIEILPRVLPKEINLDNLRIIPVAILSSTGFDPGSYVDRESLTFGRTGDERSLMGCDPSAGDMNGDGLPDLICYFDTLKSGLQPEDTRGFLKGQNISGVPLAGDAAVRVVVAK